MVYWSQAWQDEFVTNLLNFKKGGYFVDIGSTDGKNQSNSYFLESEMGWQGVCVERGIGYTEHYQKNRSCIFLNEDALEIDYKSVFAANQYPSRLDYLSLDIDENSAKALAKLPLDDYRFDIVTIEHDAYRFGDSLRNEEREILKSHNYHLLFPNVLVPLGCGMGPDLPFEDWWVDLSTFNVDQLSKLATKLASDKLYPDHIVATVKSMGIKYR
ncbi:MAG TPA: hypothetical protein VM577_15380 [Anaerovoracaceae bacterium]|nr:hypothetical protein [Anaerovoracaceae bacterium]